jgi:PleD family two-component response regulator
VAEDKMLNILLVEDDEVDVMNVRRAFKKNNIRLKPVTLANFVEAMATLNKYWTLVELP